MSSDVQVALINNITGIITAIGVIIASWLTYVGNKRSKEQDDRTEHKLDEVHKIADGGLSRAQASEESIKAEFRNRIQDMETKMHDLLIELARANTAKPSVIITEKPKK